MKYVEINRCCEDGMHLPGCDYEIDMNKLTNGRCNHKQCELMVDQIAIYYHYTKHFPRFEISIGHIGPRHLTTNYLSSIIIGCNCNGCKYIDKKKYKQFQKELRLLIRIHSI